MSGKGTVEDGTRCKADKNTYDVCIQGKCRVSDLKQYCKKITCIYFFWFEDICSQIYLSDLQKVCVATMAYEKVF